MNPPVDRPKQRRCRVGRSDAREIGDQRDAAAVNLVVRWRHGDHAVPENEPTLRHCKRGDHIECDLQGELCEAAMARRVARDAELADEACVQRCGCCGGGERAVVARSCGAHQAHTPNALSDRAQIGMQTKE